MTKNEVLDKYVESEVEKRYMQFYLDGLDAWNKEVNGKEQVYAPATGFNQYLEGYIKGRWLDIERCN